MYKKSSSQAAESIRSDRKNFCFILLMLLLGNLYKILLLLHYYYFYYYIERCQLRLYLSLIPSNILENSIYYTENGIRTLSVCVS